ncbi:MAG TPA: peptidyl-prolyl cis-trans isomerase [Trueperaceae bacterium]|nr:peptidyl-prolyl cis-trans isomerase [Trueperaceae bacterium]
MKSNRRTTTIILWIISIGLLLGMIITFTPTLGRLGGRSSGGGHGAVELKVNGQPIYQDAVSRSKQTPLYNAVSSGEVGADLQLLMVHNLVQSAVLAQASAKVHVSGGEVNKAVDSFRQSRGVAGRKNDQAYLNLIGNAGFTDPTFRDYVRQSLREQKWQTQLTKDVKVSDAEVKAWYDTHHSSYQSAEQIKAREIVVNDAKQAVELQKQAVAGADFGTLAKKYSKDLADRDGALGAAKGSTTPQPVGKPALPTAVANAAFGLKGPGITDVVQAAGQYYIVKVEQFLPAQLEAFDKVKNQVQSDALQAKKSGVVQQTVDKLMKDAKVTVPAGSELSYDNPVVAKIGDSTITAADLDQATYTNPQIQQALSPQSASLVTQFFKPAVLGQMIDTYVAYQGAQSLKLPLVGTKQMVAQAALNYVSRDAKASQDAMTKYYDSNKSSFTIPAEADATRIDFTKQADAEAFRKALLNGQAVDAAAKADSGTVKNLGTVKPGDLVTELDAALFKTNAFTSLPNSKQGISDVLALTQPVSNGSGSSGSASGSSSGSSGSSSSGSAGASSSSNAGGEAGSSSSQPQTKTSYVVLLAVRTPQRTRSFTEVKDQVQQAVLSNQQQQLRNDWLNKMKKQIKVENDLAKVQQEMQAKLKAQQQKSAAGSGSSGSSGSSGGASSGTPSSGAGSSGSGSSGTSSSGSTSSGSTSSGSTSSGSSSSGGASSGSSSGASSSGSSSGSSGSGSSGSGSSSSGTTSGSGN